MKAIFLMFMAFIFNFSLFYFSLSETGFLNHSAAMVYDAGVSIFSAFGVNFSVVISLRALRGHGYARTCERVPWVRSAENVSLLGLVDIKTKKGKKSAQNHLF